MNEQIFLSHKFELSPTERELFKNFLILFTEYNAHTNLSAIRDEEGIIEKHFVDSLYGGEILSDLLSQIRERESGTFRLLDIGSGGGFPGIPLKIVFPELQVTLLDSVGKKVKAMNHFIEKLGLENIGTIQDRAENLAKKGDQAGKYDFVVSRATAYITDILTWAKPFLKKDGHIILYKMPSEDEMGDLKKITKKLSLELEGELRYELGGKERIILVLRFKK